MSGQQLFTFVLDYAGGTYVSQYRGRSRREALLRWLAGEPRTLEELVKHPISHQLAAALAERGRLVPLEGLQNAWCCSASLPRGLALLNVIKTAE